MARKESLEEHIVSWFVWSIVWQIICTPFAVLSNAVTKKADKEHKKYASRFQDDPPENSW